MIDIHDIDQEKNRIKNAIDFIPKRILQLQLEIDNLKEVFKKHQVRYTEIMNIQQLNMIKALKESENLKELDKIIKK